jgi:hypothetical protein
MAKIKSTLTLEEKHFISTNEQSIRSIIGILDEVKQFKVGDFLVAYRPNRSSEVKKYYTNSYGAVRKYTVVALDGLGLPYMKEINKKGNPCGQLISPITYDSYNNRFSHNPHYTFDVDPGFEDAILLGEDENYKVNELHEEKSAIFKEVTLHNKKCSILTDDIGPLLKFFKTLKVGDVLWRNRNSSLVILDCSNLRGSMSLIKFQSSRGAIVEIAIQDFLYTRLYSDRPRSFKEVHDLK